MTARKPPPWPVRALIAAGAIPVTAALGGVFIGAAAAMAVHDAVRAALGRPPLWRRGHTVADGSHDACTLTKDEAGQWHCIAEHLIKEAGR